ncbi:MAG: hypothetical protein LAP87_11730 [Acidobacteriia bacterium]|nr:hypothetical protein [Terriglobia bacterium]
MGGRWVTESSDIADSTKGDAATTARVVARATTENVGTFTENAASGKLAFMDKATNTIFSLVPPVTIAAGATVHLLFSASFDNNVLHLAAGTAARTEVIVTFGRSSGTYPTDYNMDINGNGKIDADELKVHSVTALIPGTIPATLAANAALTLTDTAADITATGTVTVTNPVIQLGATTGTASATYNGGASGGSVTNCAHATGSGITRTVGAFQFPIVAPVKLDACNTQAINARVCTPGTLGCGWHDGDMTTFGPNAWGTDGTGPLALGYNTVYAPTQDVFEIGDPAGFELAFGREETLQAFLPALGPIGPLNTSLVDPTTCLNPTVCGFLASGVFGGEVAALKLNIDFADAGLTLGKSSRRFGDLTLCNFIALSDINGLTVRQFSQMVNTLLGGGTTIETIGDLYPVSVNLNAAFLDGVVSPFARQNLGGAGCQAVTWADGDVITHTQFEWSKGVLDLNYNAVYAATQDVFEVGSPSGFTVDFTGVTELRAYLPANGLPGPLDASLVDPTSTDSGTFGGEVVALKLNIDFSDAGLLPGAAHLRFGDLTLCNFSTFPTLNGLTVRQFSTQLNTLLGGGSGAFNIPDIDLTAATLNVSFFNGGASAFAQQHLVNGACQ